MSAPEGAAPHPRPIRIGVSACLLGREVRWNGGHKRDTVLCERLGPLVEWVPVCPEEEIGLGVPREPLVLRGDAARPRLVGRDSGRDHTERMLAWARMRVERLAQSDLCGFVLKSGSPSCGRDAVEIRGETRDAVAAGPGLFARVLLERLPRLPIAEESRLWDPAARAEFLERARAYGGRRD